MNYWKTNLVSIRLWIAVLPLPEQSLSRNDGEDQTRRNAENMFGDD
uniref:Uncharacterized protein n=1 Tax=Salmonella dublin TaxID=98360 RepID=F5BQC9_SALDU|nr:hypothetical protein pSD853_88_95 [Salmonella enterica subsp. enterica serovar Dublin]